MNSWKKKRDSYTSGSLSLYDDIFNYLVACGIQKLVMPM